MKNENNNEIRLKTENSTEIKPLIKLLKASIFSAYLKEDKSFSVLIMAKAQGNKTNSLMRFSEVKGISVHTDLTYWSLVKEVLIKMQKGEINTLIIPDMLKPIEKGKTTSKNFITVLNSLIEEGVNNLSLGFLDHDFEGMQKNMLTSITPKIFRKHKRYWNSIGFMTRIIPFSYSYSKEFDELIKNKINRYEVKRKEKEDFELPMFKQNVSIGLSYTQLVNKHAEELSKQDSEYATYYKDKKTVHDSQEYSYRHIEQFQCLLKSLALMRGSNKVEDCDLEDFNKIIHYCNYNENIYPNEEYVIKVKKCPNCGKEIPEHKICCSNECIIEARKKGLI